MLTIYRLLTLLLTPLALLWLERGPVEPGASGKGGRWRERLGRVPIGRPGRLWLHAASVGEVNAAAGLIRALVTRGETVLVSTMTRTGATRCAELFGAAVEHHYLPLDNPLAVRAWLRRAQPGIGLIVETEIWPELYDRCQRSEIPLLLVNARISPVAQRRYRRFRPLVARALSAVAQAICQTETDAERLVGLGLPATRVQLSGNLKFDFEPPAGLDERARALRQAWGRRPVWVAGSTRPGEEAILLEAHRRLRHSQPEALLILAPRHLERLEALGRMLDSAELNWCRLGDQAHAATAVILVDRLGVLLEHYAAADVAFVGGSLVAMGGHNLLEPAALAKPVLAGPHLEQQADAARVLGEGDGLIVVRDGEELASALSVLLGDQSEQQRRGAAAQAAVQAGRGSLQVTLAALEPWLVQRDRAGRTPPRTVLDY